MIKLSFRRVGLRKDGDLKKTVRKLPRKGWKVVSMHRLINKVKQTGTTESKTESGRLRTVITEENIMLRKCLLPRRMCPGTHKSQRQIAAQLQVSMRSVQRMTKDLGFKGIKVSRRDASVRTKHKTLCRNLYHRYSNEDVKKIVFMDEKDFTLEIARNRQNNRVYSARKKYIPAHRFYHESHSFTKKIIVPDGVS